MIRMLLASAALAATALAAGPSAARDPMSGEQQLARLLEGRVAGEPRSCVDTFRNRDTKIVDGTALVVGRGKTIWVNVPANARDLDRNDAIVTRQFGTRLCRQDIVHTFDLNVGFQTGVIFLTDFVPYTRVD